MNNWQVDLFTGLGRADSVQDIVDATAKIIKPIGFEYCGFRLLFPLPLSRPQLITTYTAEDEMYEKERNGGYLETPMSVHCSQSMTPFVWEGTTEDSVFRQMPEVFEEYYGYGHRGGWAQSLIEKQNMYSLFYADSSNSMTAAHLENGMGRDSGTEPTEPNKAHLWHTAVTAGKRSAALDRRWQDS